MPGLATSRCEAGCISLDLQAPGEAAAHHAPYSPIRLHEALAARADGEGQMAAVEWPAARVPATPRSVASRNRLGWISQSTEQPHQLLAEQRRLAHRLRE